MNPRKKEIQSVNTGNICLESYPCQHEVTIQYKDGTEKKQWANGRTIAEKYGSYLDKKDKKHFKEYVASGLFGNKSTPIIQPEINPANKGYSSF